MRQACGRRQLAGVGSTGARQHQHQLLAQSVSCCVCCALGHQRCALRAAGGTAHIRVLMQGGFGACCVQELSTRQAWMCLTLAQLACTAVSQCEAVCVC